MGWNKNSIGTDMRFYSNFGDWCDTQVTHSLRALQKQTAFTRDDVSGLWCWFYIHHKSMKFNFTSCLYIYIILALKNGDVKHTKIMLQLNIACFQGFHANIHHISSHIGTTDLPRLLGCVCCSHGMAQTLTHVGRVYFASPGLSQWLMEKAEPDFLILGPCSTLNRLDFDLQFLRIFSISLRLTLQKTNI